MAAFGAAMEQQMGPVQHMLLLVLVVWTCWAVIRESRCGGLNHRWVMRLWEMCFQQVGAGTGYVPRPDSVGC